MFPGTIEQLFKQGQEALKMDLHEEAAEYFEEILLYTSEEPRVYGPLAIALYETKQFERAKEFAILALQHDPEHYIETLELYLSISIQLQEYDEVEMTIGALLEEQIIPKEMLQKFNYLRELNGRLADRYAQEERNDSFEEGITLEQFMSMSGQQQQELLTSFENKNLVPHTPLLVQIVEQAGASPIVITYAMILLYKAGYAEPVRVKKCTMEGRFIPSALSLPGEDELTKKVLYHLERNFDKDPTANSLANDLITKYSIVMYPFDWGQSTAEEIANAYIEYTEHLLKSQPPASGELAEWIRLVDEKIDF